MRMTKLRVLCGLAIVAIFCGYAGIINFASLAQEASIVSAIGGVVLCGISIATIVIAWTCRNSWS
jgi:hypothetical protein